MSSPRSTSGVHKSSVVRWFLKSCMIRTASLPSGSSTATLCAPHSDFLSGVAAASAASALGQNTTVRGGGASGPAARTSARICRARATSFLRRGTTRRLCDTPGGTLPGFPMDTASGPSGRRNPRARHRAVASSGTRTPHRTICLSSITGAYGLGFRSSSIASAWSSNSWSASSAMIVCARSTSRKPERFIRASASGVPTTTSATSAKPSRVSWSSSNTPTHFRPCGPK